MAPRRYQIIYAPVAQLDRASDSDSEGRRFKSSRACQLSHRRTFERFFYGIVYAVIRYVAVDFGVWVIDVEQICHICAMRNNI